MHAHVGANLKSVVLPYRHGQRILNVPTRPQHLNSGDCVLRTDFSFHLVQRPAEGNETAVDGLSFSKDLEEKNNYTGLVSAPFFSLKLSPLQGVKAQPLQSLFLAEVTKC